MVHVPLASGTSTDVAAPKSARRAAPSGVRFTAARWLLEGERKLAKAVSLADYLVGMRPRAIYIMLPLEPGDAIDTGNSGGSHPNGDETGPKDG